MTKKHRMRIVLKKKNGKKDIEMNDRREKSLTVFDNCDVIFTKTSIPLIILFLFQMYEIIGGRCEFLHEFVPTIYYTNGIIVIYLNKILSSRFRTYIESRTLRCNQTRIIDF